jgi:uncharacterized MAPEG superfamily protein
MSIPFWCLFVAVNFPYVWGGVSVNLRKKEFGAIDNHEPRAQAAKATGAAARAYAAHLNAWEALAVFAPAVIVAHLGAPNSTVAPILALVWVAARLLHGVLYIANIAAARSAVFGVALLAAMALFFVGAGIL